MNKYLPFLFTAVILVFIADLYFPIGMPAGLFYVLLLIAGSRMVSYSNLYILAVFSSVSLLLVPVVSPESGIYNLLNRTIAVMLLWIIAFVLVRLRKYEDLLKESELKYKGIAEVAAGKQKAEKALEKSQARLSSIVSSAMDAIITINREQQIILFNKAAEKMFGYREDEILGKELSILIPASLRTLHKQFVNNFGNTGVTNRHMGALGAVRGVKKNGTEFPIEASISQIDTSGEKLYTVILRDITEREIAEQNLLESEHRFRNMADNAPVLIWISDERMNINYLNKTWLNFSGRDLSQEINSGWQENIYPEDRKMVLEVYNNAFDKKESFTAEFRMKRADGSYRWILNQGIPRFIHNKMFIGFIGSGIDITERKLFEEQINASLKEKEVLLKEVHHRVKNNLQIISSLLNLQSEHIKDEKMIELLVESQNRIKSMALIHEKLYQTKALSKIDPKGYITELVENLLHSYLPNRSEIDLHLDIDDIETNVDTGIDIGLIINELVSNILKYAFPNGFKGNKQITILLKNDPSGKTRLVIRDSGIGIPDSFRIDEAQSLGLQLVDTLVQQLEGTFNFRYDDGAVIEIEF